ncbi:unnamed protein product, partial [Heterosigma akashiwo]
LGPAHRPSFRRIAASADRFVRFANGLMNETNALVASVMEKLPEIRQAQLRMKNVVEWLGLTDQEKQEVRERLEGRRTLRDQLRCCCAARRCTWSVPDLGRGDPAPVPAAGAAAPHGQHAHGRAAPPGRGQGARPEGGQPRGPELPAEGHAAGADGHP